MGPAPAEVRFLGRGGVVSASLKDRGGVFHGASVQMEKDLFKH